MKFPRWFCCWSNLIASSSIQSNWICWLRILICYTKTVFIKWTLRRKKHIFMLFSQFFFSMHRFFWENDKCLFSHTSHFFLYPNPIFGWNQFPANLMESTFMLMEKKSRNLHHRKKNYANLDATLNLHVHSMIVFIDFWSYFIKSMVKLIFSLVRLGEFKSVWSEREKIYLPLAICNWSKEA